MSNYKDYMRSIGGCVSYNEYFDEAFQPRYSRTTGKLFERRMELDNIQDSIKSILVNNKIKRITVVFDDDDVQMIDCNKHDEFDVNVGVALAITHHIFGSKNKYHKYLNKTIKQIN